MIPIHPAAQAQDLIDRLKSLTRPIGEAEAKDLATAWNELEDLLVMLASSRLPLAQQQKLDTLRTIIAAIDDLRKTETRDVDSDEKPGRIAAHRRSGGGDSTGSEGRPSSSRGDSSEGGQGPSF